MGAPALIAGATRLKREDCRRTKHDSSFSKWKILIGPSDWEDHSLRKEGAGRYRIQNLPSNPGPGVYEIGVAVWVWPTGSGRDVGKMDPDRIVVVYLGQAENVRSRLQSYGRGGAHLEKRTNGSPWLFWAEELHGSSNGSGHGSPGLFKEIFTRGFPIVYRWAPMSSKKDAERTEGELLAHFDYAWNKVGNGTKRPTDVFLKVDEVSSKTNSTTPKVLKMLKSLTEKKVGIPIKPSISSSPNKTCHDDDSNQGTDTERNKLGLFARVLKFGRNQPRMVVPHDDDTLSSVECQNLTAISECGVSLADGSICRNRAVEGRKRCSEHKGMKKSTSNGTDHYDEEKKKPTAVVGVVGELFVPICGVILLNGSPCTENPITGRKRCEEHKGKRVFSPPEISYQEAYSTAIVDFEDSILDRESMSCNDGNCCGINLSCGSYCKKLPVKGRKRCEEHKGMRINGGVTQ